MSIVEISKEKHKQRRKIALIILGGIVLFLVFAQLFMMWLVVPKAEDYLIRKIYEKTHRQYVLSIDDIDVNIFTQKIKANSVYLKPIESPDSLKKLTRDEVELFIPEITANGLSFWSALWNRKIVISNVDIKEPRIVLKRNSKTDANPSQFSRHRKYYRLLKGLFNAALVKNVTVDNGYLEVYRMLDPYENVATIQSVNLNLKDVSLDSVANKKSNGYLNIGELEAKLSAYSQRSPDSSYLLSVGSMEISSKRSAFLVKDINVMPLERPAEAELATSLLYEIYVPEFNLNDIDLAKLYEDRRLRIAAIKIPSAAIKVMGSEVKENRSDTVQEVNYYPLVSEYLEVVHIEKLLLEGTRLDIVNTKSNKRYSLDHADIFLYDFRMDSSLLKKRNKLFYSEKVFIKTPDSKQVLPDSLFFFQPI